MTPTSDSRLVERADAPLQERDLALLDRFSNLVTERAAMLARGPDRARVLELVKRAVLEVGEALSGTAGAANLRPVASPDQLPMSKLKVSEVVGQGWVALSQASFYRAVESKRFYCVTPPGRTIGKEFPAWQFVPPAPELIAPVLGILDDMPSSEIHAFWVGEAEQLNDMSPAEVLTGLPFETRQTVHKSQWTILRLPSNERMRRVAELAEFRLRSVAEIIG